MCEGVASVPRARSITGFLSSRKGGLLALSSLTASAVNADVSHVLVRLAKTTCIWCLDAKRSLRWDDVGDTKARRVRMIFEDGSVVLGELRVPNSLRVSDFISNSADFVALSSAQIGEFDVQCAAVNLSTVTAIHDLGDVGAPAKSGKPLEQSIKRRTSRISLILHELAE